jgi:hypothetical protein
MISFITVFAVSHFEPEPLPMDPEWSRIKRILAGMFAPVTNGGDGHCSSVDEGAVPTFTVTVAIPVALSVMVMVVEPTATPVMVTTLLVMVAVATEGLLETAL